MALLYKTLISLTQSTGDSSKDSRGRICVTELPISYQILHILLEDFLSKPRSTSKIKEIHILTWEMVMKSMPLTISEEDCEKVGEQFVFPTHASSYTIGLVT